MKPVHVVGGGLAGLVLGIGLRKLGAPVTVREARGYPRHRVCGEFLSGAGQHILATLGLDGVLQGAYRNRTTGWFAGDRMLFVRELPVPAVGLSRFHLDHRLAAVFEAAGGELKRHSRVRHAAGDGLVWATGRHRGDGNLIGLKLHCRNLPQAHDLSMYLGSHGYVGVSKIEEDKSNVCGLFRTRRELSPGRDGMMEAYLRANGLHQLADALREAEIDRESITATAASDFSLRHGIAQSICIGDSHTSIPPFAGNGMSMALESAHTAIPHLHSYVCGQTSWEEACIAVRRALRSIFRLRLAVSRAMHPLLVQPRGRLPLEQAVATDLLPFSLLFRVLR